LGGDAQIVEIVSDELKVPKVIGFTEGESIACQTFTVGRDGDHRSGNHQNINRKTMLQIPLPRTPTVSVFCTGKTGWSRSRVPVLRWSCELQST
jgi:hypothetical protein